MKKHVSRTFYCQCAKPGTRFYLSFLISLIIVSLWLIDGLYQMGYINQSDLINIAICNDYLIGFMLSLCLISLVIHLLFNVVKKQQ